MSAARISPKAAPSLSVIQADSVIPLPLAQQYLGMGKWALREAKKRGLKVTIIGRRGYILGTDLLDFVRAEQERQAPSPTAAGN